MESPLAGKSTLLQILAGKRLVSNAQVTIKGKDVFRQYPGGVTFLGTEWCVYLSPLNLGNECDIRRLPGL